MLYRCIGRRASVLATIAFLAPTTFAETAGPSIDEVTVTSQRREQPVLSHQGNTSVLSGDIIESAVHQHVHELLTRVAGAWISRGSGQESLPSIRSPVLTGAGSCGSFMVLEDSVPIRPTGFCNVNQLFEVNSEQADRIEVVRGPGNALYGSNAMHGMINVLMPRTSGNSAALELGVNEFVRVRTRLQGRSGLLALIHADDGGFRESSGYTQTKLHVSTGIEFDMSSLQLAMTATHLDQETAGFIVGEDAYRDPLLNRSNPNPEAFREASSQRVYGLWSIGDVDVRPFLRHSDMRFLQHFLPGQPLEENGHVSAGAIVSKTFDRENSGWQIGIDAEWADVYLKQTQSGPTEGSAFLRETRPSGKHYDYDVSSISVAPWLQGEIDLTDRLTLSVGLRLEYLRYRYENNMLSGNTRDDGSVCGFGGCLYSRPQDRNDSFFNAAPKFGFNYTLDAQSRMFANVVRGFRAPQMTELYRLQSGQQVVDLDSEQVDSIELGWRRSGEDLQTEVVAYWMKKRDSVLRDAEGFNVGDGGSRHNGLEATVAWQISGPLRARLNAAYGRHEYDFDLVAARGETFVSGNDIDTAPRWLAGMEIFLAPNTAFEVALQWTMIDEYFVDAENRHRYPGHDLVNLRVAADLQPGFSITARLNNVFDEDVADRADFAFGNYRYFPGRGRELFVEFRYQ